MGTVSTFHCMVRNGDRTSARSVALNTQCVKEQLNEPWYRFQICGFNIITPIICYGDVQGATIFVDAFQCSLN